MCIVVYVCVCWIISALSFAMCANGTPMSCAPSLRLHSRAPSPQPNSVRSREKCARASWPSSGVGDGGGGGTPRRDGGLYKRMHIVVLCVWGSQCDDGYVVYMRCEWIANTLARELSKCQELRVGLCLCASV